MTKIRPRPQPAPNFWTLPNEIIYRIISQTRPSGFQNIMLACKRTYYVGKSLTADHNFCTKWAAAYDNPGDACMGTQPVLVLRQLLSAPSNVQEWLLLYDYPELEPHLRVYDRKGTEIDLGPYHPIFNDNSDDEYYDPRYVYDSSHLTMGANPTFYHMSTLLALFNLKRLAMSVLPDITSSAKLDDRLYTLPWFIYVNHGQRYFQQLEQLKLQDSTCLSMGDIFTLTTLPRLKALRVDSLRFYPKEPEYNSRGSATVNNFSIEYLVLFCAAVPTDVVGPFLNSLCSLKTLIWEDSLKEFSRWRDEEGNECQGLLQGRTLSFNPRQLVGHLAIRHHSTLEHLVLTTKTDPEDYVPQQDQIEHFKELVRLTHLEFDTQLLQNIQDLTPGSPPRYQSLTQVLPSCIQVVCVIVRKGYFQKICEMLQEVPKQRSQFPTLRQISIQFAEYGTAHERATGLISLQHQFLEVGMQLEVMEMTKLEMKGRLDITIDRNGTDMRWFFNMAAIVEDTSAYGQSPFLELYPVESDEIVNI